MIKAVIFDMGGVILRTDDPAKREAMARRLGTTRADLEAVVFESPTSIRAELGEIPEAEHWKLMAERYGQPPETYHELHMEFFSGDEVDLELIDFIQSLKPKYKLGMLSNAWTNARRDITRIRPYLDLFDASIFSCEVNLRKPDARIFELMLKRLGVQADEAIFVDDFQRNIAGAAAIGLHTILFQNRQTVEKEIRQLLHA